MHALPAPRLLRAASTLIATAALFALGACGDDGAATCAEPGATVACSCGVGTTGTAPCLDDGTTGTCTCAGGDAGVGADTGTGGDAGGGTDTGGSDAGGGEVTESFFGERQCPFTTSSFAAGQWSDEDTTMITVLVDEVDGGFAIGGIGEESPFGSCEVVFDLDGTTATFREPQPCNDGIVRYLRGRAIIDADTFSIDVFGEGQGIAAGVSVSMKVDCGAGPLPPEEEPVPEGFEGNWACDGTVRNPMAGDGELPQTFTMTNSATVAGRFESTFTPSSDMDILIRVLESCLVQWSETSDIHADITAESQCSFGPDVFVRSDTGLDLDADGLSGSFFVEAQGAVQDTYTFTCVR